MGGPGLLLPTVMRVVAGGVTPPSLVYICPTNARPPLYHDHRINFISRTPWPPPSITPITPTRWPGSSKHLLAWRFDGDNNSFSPVSDSMAITTLYPLTPPNNLH